MGNSPFSSVNGINEKLTKDILSLGHLRIYLRMRFPSLRTAGRTAGLSYSRIKQIVTGYKLPENPELIYKIANAWDIDPIVLTQLFEKYRGIKNE